MESKPDQDKVAGKKVWRSPEIKEVGDLATVVRSLVPGKNSPGMDGGGVGGGEEMRMAGS